MDSRLLNAGIIAIPLKENTESKLFPQPNFLIINSLYGKTYAEIPDLGSVLCANTEYKIVYREILPNELGREEEVTERVLEHENQPVPTFIVSALYEYKTISENLETINMLLSKFQFRGSLKGFVLEVDKDVLSKLV